MRKPSCYRKNLGLFHDFRKADLMSFSGLLEVDEFGRSLCLPFVISLLFLNYFVCFHVQSSIQTIFETLGSHPLGLLVSKRWESLGFKAYTIYMIAPSLYKMDNWNTEKNWWCPFCTKCLMLLEQLSWSCELLISKIRVWSCCLIT